MLCEAVDKALAFEKNDRWFSAREMFGALRAAYEESRGRSAQAMPAVRQQQASASTIDVPISVGEAEEESSLVIDVAFGEHHDEAIAKERQRTREVIEGLSSLQVVVEPDKRG